MNLTPILALLEKYAEAPLETSFAASCEFYILTNPTADESTIVSDVEGAFKHMLRGKIGFAVDIIWPIVQPELDPLVTAAYQTAVAANTTPAPTP